MDAGVAGSSDQPHPWIPACAGMTKVGRIAVVAKDQVMPRFRYLLLFTAPVLAATALAQSASDLPDRPIRRAEVVAVVKRQFAMLDANHDGIVTRAEFDAFRARQAAGAVADAGPFGHVGGHWFEHADAKGDGRVTLAEAEARPLQLFDTADMDHDGVISDQERRVAAMMMSLGK